jgi:diguanylate cyclase (GGDEF)-like protein
MTEISIRGLEQWNRKILNILWGTIAIAAMVSLCYMFLFNQLDYRQYIYQYVALPVFWLVLIVCLVEWLYKCKIRYMDYAIICSSVLMASVLIHIHSSIPVMFAALFLPLLISVFYFERRKVIFSFLVVLCSYFLLAIIHESNFAEIFSMLSMLAAATYICLGIMQRGLYIARYLQKAVQSEQELMIKNTIMEKLSKSDSLTGLYNHISFHQFLEELIEPAEQNQLSLHLAIIDIDDFKFVNDTYGHRVGDMVLETVSHKIKEIVTADDFVARYGGEEFVVLFTDKNTTEVYERVDSIREEISQLIFSSMKDCEITVSIGVNEYIPGMGKEKFFQGADSSLYKAKRTGKNKVIAAESND